MPRIMGVDIPNNKRVVVALTYIHGIGRKKSELILEKLKIDESLRAKSLTEDQVAKIADALENEHVVEGSLRRLVQQHINRLKEIACFRGLRHRKGLPVRGQRTKTNGRTRKGPKKSGIAVKRSVKAMK